MEKLIRSRQASDVCRCVMSVVLVFFGGGVIGFSWVFLFQCAVLDVIHIKLMCKGK